MLQVIGESKGEGRKDHLTLRGGPLGRSEGRQAGGTWVEGGREGKEIDGGRTHKVTRQIPRIIFMQGMWMEDDNKCGVDPWIPNLGMRNRDK